MQQQMPALRKIIIASALILFFSYAANCAATTQKESTETTTQTEPVPQSSGYYQEGLAAQDAQQETDNDQNAYSNTDPYEKFNRQIFGFNRTIDKILIRPIAKTYNFILPNFAQKGVSNFFGNVGEIPNVANDILQANPVQTMSDLWRFVINTTVGIGGLFDVASRIGLKSHHNDLGLTFNKWGAKNTPYLVLPILGSSTIGDTVGLPINYELLTLWPHLKPSDLRLALLGTELISIRNSFLPTDKIINEAFDPYVAMRNAYLQHRVYLLQRQSN
ncbi:MAG: hypothetical protein A2X78_04565 [Gammaproteobacteria bacterium GWE2_37_16]|nr:MAG: hypothetical protein A2X78_04565 [Gammaproteobacteria bacterium GWE2_37_16]